MPQARTHVRLISRQIDQMESTNQFYRRVLQRFRQGVDEIIREVEEQNGRFPPLPPRLPRPEYALTANSLDRSAGALEFYWACEHGDLDVVAAFVERQHDPPGQGTLQYGLEQASFGCRVAVVQCLLTRGTILHTNCFYRTLATDKQPGGKTAKDVSILERESEGGISNNDDGIAELLRAFAHHKATNDLSILKLLLDLGADPNLGPHTGQHATLSRQRLAVNRQCPLVLNEVVRLGDVAALQLVLDHGAKADHEGLHLLHSIVVFTYGPKDPPFLNGRRQVAQYLLDQGIVEIDEVKMIRSKKKDWRMSQLPLQQETALTHACAASDWKFVEWLLDHGADPEALNRKAYTQQWWDSFLSEPNYNDPSRLVALVEERKKREDLMSRMTINE
ncbi:hypothetical protein GGR57DRAFT_495950 [Xylariaceae sp. FL1272]|nr:hypothetical protein GGR57DRAFT_495950 [Xylariaceae sp. FL1272]